MTLIEVTQLITAICAFITLVLALSIHVRVEVVGKDVKTNGLKEIQIAAMAKYLMDKDNVHRLDQTPS